MIVTVAAVVGLCALLLYLVFNLDSERHMILQLLIFFFVVTAMLYLPKAVVDGQTVCETVVANSTALNASVTAYDYESFCYERPESTGESLFGLYNRLYLLFIGYTIVYIVVWGLMKLYDSVKTRGRKR